MKVTKINGLGNYGVFIDDINLNNISDEEWLEIGKIYINNLVAIIRNTNIDYKTYYNLMLKWGSPRVNKSIYFYKKYGKPMKELIEKDLLDDVDKHNIITTSNWAIPECPGLHRISGKKDEKGIGLGAFGGGELQWHSNESGDIAFTPAVSLLGYENMQRSATGFCVSTDWYESQTESFRSELDDMILIHNYNHKPQERDAMLSEEINIYKSNLSPEENSRIPLVIKSPAGIKGLHIGYLTFDRIEGMTKEASDKLFEKIKKEMFVEKYSYHHWYENDGDLLLFDNSITLHNRSVDPEIGESPNRLGYRIQHDYDHLIDNYEPYFQEEYNTQRKERIDLIPEAKFGK
jgi:hypothetical protein